MRKVLWRIALIAIPIALIALVGWVYTDQSSAAAAAFRQYFLYVLRPVQSAFQPFVNWLGRTAQRSVLRQLMKPFWNALFAIFLGLIIRFSTSKFPAVRRLGRKKDEAFRLVGGWRLWRRKRMRMLFAPFRWLGQESRLPRWALVCIGIPVGIAALGLCVYVSLIFGETVQGYVGSFFFSMALFWLLEKIPVAGIDALFSAIARKWHWLQSLKDRHPLAKRIYEMPARVGHWLIGWVSTRRAHS